MLPNYKYVQQSVSLFRAKTTKFHTTDSQRQVEQSDISLALHSPHFLYRALRVFEKKQQQRLSVLTVRTLSHDALYCARDDVVEPEHSVHFASPPPPWSEDVGISTSGALNKRCALLEKKKKKNNERPAAADELLISSTSTTHILNLSRRQNGELCVPLREDAVG